MLIIISVSILISLIFAPLGCIALWKRYTYFSDGLAHASLLGGTISVVSGTPIIYSGSLISLIFAITVFKLKSQSENNGAVAAKSRE